MKLWLSVVAFAATLPLSAQDLTTVTKIRQEGFRNSKVMDYAEALTDRNGSGNVNQTVGDSIFHCHFYPHFAGGMWSMWRVHDVYETGTLLGKDGFRRGMDLYFDRWDGHATTVEEFIRCFAEVTGEDLSALPADGRAAHHQQTDHCHESLHHFLLVAMGGS